MPGTQTAPTAFRTVDHVLRTARAYWQLRPFAWRDYPWRASDPGLCRALDALSPEMLAHELEEPAESSAFARVLTRLGLDLAGFRAIARPPELPEPSLPLAISDGHGMPARKWHQVQAFAAHVAATDRGFVDWCAGKGHLSRTLAHAYGQSSHCLERDVTLARAGTTLAEPQDLEIAFGIQDVHDPLARPGHLRGRDWVALHACGRLHHRFLNQAVAHQAHSITLAPCCYNRLGGGERYTPLSARVCRSPLELTDHDLRLPLQAAREPTPAGAARRRRIIAWRLGFDLLQRELTGIDRYAPLPAPPRTVENRDFQAFGEWAAARLGLTLPHHVSWDDYAQRGELRLDRVKRIDWVRRPFRWLLEIWLILDQVLFLEEQGYRVEWGRFCPATATPRNLLIRAWGPD